MGGGEVQAHEIKCSETKCGQKHDGCVALKCMKTLQRVLQRLLGGIRRCLLKFFVESGNIQSSVLIVLR